MDTAVASTDSSEHLTATVNAAVESLAAGEVVALPTETVYGLAADATRADAVIKIFEAKERPFFDPLIVHLPTRDWLERVTEIPAVSRATVETLIEKFWPGPLTIVLPRRSLVPDLVTSGLETVAVRMSAHPVFRSVIQQFGKPLAAPSANRFGRISPTTAAHVTTELGGRIPLVVDGGPTAHGIESTIVAVESGRLRILRSGPITREALGDLPLAVDAPLPLSGKPQAPGQLASHYAPRTPLKIVASGASLGWPGGARVGWLGWQHRAEGGPFCATEVLSPTGDLREAAATLFAKLRWLDEAGLDLILTEPVPEEGLGVAIMDRLRKAAAPR
jgi:L-threonylcarbamoyladenylate synthase